VSEKKIKIINWITIIFILIISGFWSFWGIIENFHEGWYFNSILKNMALMFIQYLSIPIIIILLSLISIKWHKVGGLLWIFAWMGFSYLIFFGGNIPFSFKRLLIWLPITIPLLLVGFSFYFFEIRDKKRAAMLIIIFPLLIIFSLGIPNYIRVSNRYNDYDFGLRIVKGNGVTLVWAPRGPGFPKRGVNWYIARKVCSFLDESGRKLLSKRQDIWRLPTREEIVRSLTKSGKNCGGLLNEKGKPVYKIIPDKETPLWDPHSMIIYYWTSERKKGIQNHKGEERDFAYLVSYNGKVLLRYASNSADYHGFRCVKTLNIEEKRFEPDKGN